MKDNEVVLMPVDWRVSWPELMEINGAAVSGGLQEVFPPNVMTAREVLFRQKENESALAARIVEVYGVGPAMMAVEHMKCGSKKGGYGGKKGGGKKGK